MTNVDRIVEIFVDSFVDVASTVNVGAPLDMVKTDSRRMKTFKS